MAVSALMAAVCLGAAIITLGLGLKVPDAFEVRLPLSGRLLRRRALLTKRSPHYAKLLESLRFFLYHLRLLLASKWAARLVSRAWARLGRAAFPGGLSAPEYLALYPLCAVIGAALGFWFGWEVTGWPSPLFTAAFMFAALLLPAVWLEDKQKERVKVINRALPYVLDLLTLSLGAGMSFMQALTRVAGDRPEGDHMGDELTHVLHEVAMGKTRREALLAFRDRTDSPYVGEIVSSIVQAEQMGTPLVRTLRVQAMAVRLKRSQRAETLAGEAPVKMMLPMLFILMSVILTIFGSIIVRAVRGDLAI